MFEMLFQYKRNIGRRSKTSCSRSVVRQCTLGSYILSWLKAPKKQSAKGVSVGHAGLFPPRTENYILRD